MDISNSGEGRGIIIIINYWQFQTYLYRAPPEIYPSCLPLFQNLQHLTFLFVQWKEGKNEWTAALSLFSTVSSRFEISRAWDPGNAMRLAHERVDSSFSNHFSTYSLVCGATFLDPMSNMLAAAFRSLSANRLDLSLF